MNKFIEATLESVLSCVKDGVVFMDDPAAECLHWSDGLTKLFDAGALDVRDIKHNKECLESEQKCVFLVSSPLQGSILKYIQRIIKNSDFVECTIVSSLDSDVNQFIRYYLQSQFLLTVAWVFRTGTPCIDPACFTFTH